jgi:hypothetical protein
MWASILRVKMSELVVLVKQLDEIMAKSLPEDSDEALEFCNLAGMIARLDSSAPILKKAVAWREGEGAEFIEDGWSFFDTVELMDTLESATSGRLDGHELEELLFDIDEIVAGAIWCGEEDTVRAFTQQVVGEIRSSLEHFTVVSEQGVKMSKTTAVDSEQSLYEFWVAVAGAGNESLR